MSKGKVVWFDNAKGYGFIRPDESGGADLFVHHSQVIMAGYRTLNEGQPVEFQIGEYNGRVQAIDVVPREEEAYGASSS